MTDISAGALSDKGSTTEEGKEVATVGAILSKRKYIDWARTAQDYSDKVDIRPEQLDQEGPF